MDLLFPRCGITLQHVQEIAKVAKNKREAARKLGISERQFYSVIAKHNLGYLFSRFKSRKICVTKEEIIDMAQQGYTRRDTAYLLGISVDYLKRLIHRWQLADTFIITKGKASWITRRGYTN